MNGCSFLGKDFDRGIYSGYCPKKEQANLLQSRIDPRDYSREGFSRDYSKEKGSLSFALVSEPQGLKGHYSRSCHLQEGKWTWNHTPRSYPTYSHHLHLLGKQTLKPHPESRVEEQIFCPYFLKRLLWKQNLLCT